MIQECVCDKINTHAHRRLENGDARASKFKRAPNKKQQRHNNRVTSVYASNFRHSSRAWSRFASATSDNERSLDKNVADYLTDHRSRLSIEIRSLPDSAFPFSSARCPSWSPPLASALPQLPNRSRLLTLERGTSRFFAVVAEWFNFGCRRASLGITSYIQNGPEERSGALNLALGSEGRGPLSLFLSLSLSPGLARTLSRKSLRSGRVPELASFWNSSRERMRYLRFSFNRSESRYSSLALLLRSFWICSRFRHFGFPRL